MNANDVLKKLGQILHLPPEQPGYILDAVKELWDEHCERVIEDGNNKFAEIRIVVDTNDADYLTKCSQIDNETLEIIKPLIEAIKKFKPYKGKRVEDFTFSHHHNYPLSDYVRTDLGEKTPRELYDFPEETFDIFEEYLPRGEHGFHTIESIEVYPLPNKIKLL